ncbi:winged helix-turn-helix transcriptional regulator [Kaistella sp. G5-32]|uniref:Winged helix-turn-helix transcriptional regulator n=1 Tax=Kaistella gelatinilytica TaxID=2787636 RepID=A0ABS0F7Z0_9FLAO|nr:SatD family protein [Kaistella gelatinilytica]MBF8455824.1 winged helix-turn-helix transcriptional regulator [Kaistella gelatinilytica]
MIAIITGDIINSQNSQSELWLPKLKDLLGSWSATPQNWEVYRGDEFQLKCSVDEVFHKALLLKSLIRSFENLDVRLAIGIGNEVFQSEKITESNGSAYVNSGRLLTEIKSQGRTLAIQTENEKVKRDLNILFRWASIDFDNWTAATAEIIHQLLRNPALTQEELAKELNITQSSVSQRIKRANFELLQETDQFFRKKIAEL